MAHLMDPSLKADLIERVVTPMLARLGRDFTGSIAVDHREVLAVGVLVAGPSAAEAQRLAAETRGLRIKDRDLVCWAEPWAEFLRKAHHFDAQRLWALMNGTILYDQTTSIDTERAAEGGERSKGEIQRTKDALAKTYSEECHPCEALKALASHAARERVTAAADHLGAAVDALLDAVGLAMTVATLEKHSSATTSIEHYVELVPRSNQKRALPEELRGLTSLYDPGTMAQERLAALAANFISARDYVRRTTKTSGTAT